MKTFYIQKIKPHLPKLLGLCALVVFYIVIGCPIRSFFGICCPGCGMTRAAFSIIELDFVGAFHYHPLIFIMPLCAIIIFLRKRLNDKMYNGLIALAVILFSAVYIYRLITDNEYVYIDFSRGLIYKAVQYIISLL